MTVREAARLLAGLPERWQDMPLVADHGNVDGAGNMEDPFIGVTPVTVTDEDADPCLVYMDFTSHGIGTAIDVYGAIDTRCITDDELFGHNRPRRYPRPAHSL